MDDGKKFRNKVELEASSYIEVGSSTVGVEAIFMLLGFKKGAYPPTLNSTRINLNEKEKADLLKWCEEEVAR